MRVGLLLFLLPFLAACQDKAAPPAVEAGAAATPATPATPASAPAVGAVQSAAPAVTANATRHAKIIAQHILVAWRGAKGAPKGVTRSKADARTRADEVVAKVHAGGDFTSLVAHYSDDPGSVDRQGSVGKFAPGDMDPAFSAAAFALRVDEVSAPVESPFGYHVIRRTQ